MTSSAAVYMSTCALLLVSVIAIVFWFLFVWNYVFKMCINKKFVNFFNVIAFLILGCIFTIDIVIFIYLSNE